MKICAACHEDLPKNCYSKKQWKLDQRRCKICVTNNQEVQPIPTKQHNNNQNTNEIIKALDSMYLKGIDKISDEDLFKQPPPNEDCPICFLRMPILDTGWRYMTCCGKTICSGCSHAPLYDDQGNKVDNEKCPYCRTPYPDYEEMIERERKRVDTGDAVAIFNLGFDYTDGSHGMPQNYTKALELFYRAAELGYFEAYNSIGYAYQFGEGVEIDKKKARHYYELAAMGGNVQSRHNLGIMEKKAGNFDRALKHYMIAVECGDAKSLNQINGLYKNGHATKEHYTKALQSYQAYLGEIKSVQRDEAAATHENCRYY